MTQTGTPFLCQSTCKAPNSPLLKDPAISSAKVKQETTHPPNASHTILASQSVHLHGAIIKKPYFPKFKHQRLAGSTSHGANTHNPFSHNSPRISSSTWQASSSLAQTISKTKSSVSVSCPKISSHQIQENSPDHKLQAEKVDLYLV